MPKRKWAIARFLFMDKEVLLQKVREMAEPIVSGMGLELVDVEFKLETGGWVLRLYIDREGGVTLDDCVKVSGELGVVLDVEDLIPHRYNLEVSSPGLDRPLKRLKDFLRFKGKKVRVRCFEPLGGRKNFTGLIKEVIGEDIVIKGGQGEEWVIPLDRIEKARLVI